MIIRNLSDMMNEIICDNILRKFEGITSIARENLSRSEFYANIDPDYSVIEDHIHFLIRDHSLKENEATISLTTKGWFMLTNADKVGYVARRIESVRQENYEKDTRTFFRWTTILSAVLILSWLAFKLMGA